MVELEPPPPQQSAPSSSTTPKPPNTAARVSRVQTTRPAPFKPDTQPLKSVQPSPPTPTTPDIKTDTSPPPASHTTSDETPALTQPVASPVNSAAHSIAQPLPVLPDDLREQAYQTVATARFMIHADGSVDVELIKPTSNPRLNQILLEALHQWRFFPALQNGHPIDSQQDIRVHFNVD
ncbi:energy transducer TonB [Paraburkholderia metrosideri]|nr:energy transducer TonB [Paraburkholderia metrosideri]